ncbi:MAG: IclR family transcriptional regulator [Nocardioidaceae bacterium]
MPTTGTQAVDRAAQLLALVVQADEPISFTELTEETGLARSTCSRLLASLERNFLLERDANGAFVSGPLFALYAARHDPWEEVARLADPVLRELGEQTRETVNLAVPRGSTVVHVNQIDSTYVLGARDWVGVDVPAHCSALGKVLYAYGCLPPPDGTFDRPTQKSVAGSAQLEQQLAEVVQQGYAVAREELEIGLDAVAAPVHGRDGDVVAAVGVSGPSARLGQQIDEVGRLLVKQAANLSDLLRGRMRKEGRR